MHLLRRPALAALALLAACSSPDVRVTEAAVRLDLDAGLNEAAGLAVGEATVDADTPFRLRFEVEASIELQFAGLEASRNGGPWTPLLGRDHPYPDEISSPWTSAVRPSAFGAGMMTSDLLEGSSEVFAGGRAMGLDSVTSELPIGQSEWEWEVVIRRWSDDATFMEAGDRIEYRMVDQTGAAIPGATATVTLAVPEGHLGGTYAETPGRLGPWQSADGHLWFPMEPAETYNVLMMMTSADGGVTWTESDGANRPVTDDLEGFATAFRDGRIHILHQLSERVVYHAFGTSDDGQTGWVVRDEAITDHAEPPVQVAALEALEDGRLVAAFANGNDLEIRVRSAEGTWSDARPLPAPAGRIHSGVQSALDAEGRVHLAWSLTNGLMGSVLHTVLEDDGTPGEIRTLGSGVAGTESDVGALAPLVPLPGGRVSIIWRQADGRLLERRVDANGPVTLATIVSNAAVVQNAVDSDQVGADAALIGDVLYVTYIERDTGNLHLVRSAADGEWSDPMPLVEGVTVQWVRGTAVTRPDGHVVYGYVYDAGSEGGSGMNRYGEFDPGA